MLNSIDGNGGVKVIKSLTDIAPDFGKYLIVFLFGDIYARPRLDLKSREIATVPALTALENPYGGRPECRMLQKRDS